MLTEIGHLERLQTVKSARAGHASEAGTARAATRPVINLRMRSPRMRPRAGYCGIGRATRKPTSLLRREDSTAKRAAERKTPGSLAHDPPRTTREPHSPLVQAEPSDGAP